MLRVANRICFSHLPVSRAKMVVNDEKQQVVVDHGAAKDVSNHSSGDAAVCASNSVPWTETVQEAPITTHTDILHNMITPDVEASKDVAPQLARQSSSLSSPSSSSNPQVQAEKKPKVSGRRESNK